MKLVDILRLQGSWDLTCPATCARLSFLNTALNDPTQAARDAVLVLESLLDNNPALEVFLCGASPWPIAVRLDDPLRDAHRNVNGGPVRVALMGTNHPHSWFKGRIVVQLESSAEDALHQMRNSPPFVWPRKWRVLEVSEPFEGRNWQHRMAIHTSRLFPSAIPFDPWARAEEALPATH
jgi:hypothetical protein